VSCQSTTCRAVGDGGTILAMHGVPAQPSGRGFGLTAGPLPVLDSAMLSWTVGTQQTGYDVLRFAADSHSLAILPASGSPLPAPAQSFQDADTLIESLYCYALVPLSGDDALGTSDPLCLAPHTHSASGAPPSFTLRLNQSSTASLTWIPPGGQAGYVLVAIPSNGSQRYQILSATATSATDDTTGQPTCYLLIALANGSVMGNSDVECGIPGVFSVAPPGAPQAPAIAPRTHSTSSVTGAALSLRQAVIRAKDVRHLLPEHVTKGRLTPWLEEGGHRRR
jgi:hypothetical protein